jgi:hypothetical protein
MDYNSSKFCSNKKSDLHSMNMYNLIDHNIIVIENSRPTIATHRINYFSPLHQCFANGPSC